MADVLQLQAIVSANDEQYRRVMVNATLAAQQFAESATAANLAGMRSAQSVKKAYDDLISSVNGGTTVMQRFGGLLSQHSTAMLQTGGLMAAGLVASERAAASFQRQMELTHTQAGATQAQVDSLSKSVLNLSTSVGTGPEELAKGLYHIVSVGVPAAQQMEVLKIGAEGAKVGMADLEQTVNALAATTVSHIKGVKDTADAMGQLNAIVGAGNMRMNDLNAALSTGLLARARNVGLSLRDVGAGLDVLTDSGMKAQPAAMRIGMSFSLMAAPTRAAAKALGEIGLSQTALASDMRKPNGLLVAINDLSVHLTKAGLTAEEQAQVIVRAFGGGRSSAAIETLLQNLGRLNAEYEQIAKTSGDFGKAWADTQKETAFQTGRFTASLKVLEIEAGEKLLPQATALMQGLTALTESFNHLSGEGQEAIVKTTEFGAGLLLLGGATGKAIMFIGGVKEAWTTLVGTTEAAKVAMAASEAGIAAETGAAMTATGGSMAGLAAAGGPIALLIAAVGSLAMAWVTDFGHIREYTFQTMDALSKRMDQFADHMQANPTLRKFLGILGIDPTTPARQAAHDLGGHYQQEHEHNRTPTHNDMTQSGAAVMAAVNQMRQVRTPIGEASCAYFASEFLQKAGLNVPTIANAAKLTDWLHSHGANQVMNNRNIHAGDYLDFSGGNFGKVSGHHAGIYIGNNQVMDSSGTGPGHQRIRSLSPYDIAHMRAYSLPDSLMQPIMPSLGNLPVSPTVKPVDTERQKAIEEAVEKVYSLTHDEFQTRIHEAWKTFSDRVDSGVPKGLAKQELNADLKDIHRDRVQSIIKAMKDEQEAIEKVTKARHDEWEAMVKDANKYQSPGGLSSTNGPYKPVAGMTEWSVSDRNLFGGSGLATRGPASGWQSASPDTFSAVLMLPDGTFSFLPRSQAALGNVPGPYSVPSTTDTSDPSGVIRRALGQSLPNGGTFGTPTMNFLGDPGELSRKPDTLYSPASVGGINPAQAAGTGEDYGLQDAWQSSAGEIRRRHIKEQFDQLWRNSAESMDSIFTASFEGLFQHGAKGFFQNFLQGFDQMLQEMAAKFLAAQALMAIGGAIGGQAGGDFSQMGHAILNGLGFGGGRAAGGPVDAGQMYLVGEKGPEVLVMGRGSSGTVVPNGRSISGGNTYIQQTQHFHISSPDASTFRQSRAQIETEYARSMSRQSARNH